MTQQTITLGILRTSSIGDVVLSTSAIDYLKQLEASSPHLQFKVYFISKKPCLDLLKSGISQVEVLDMEADELRIKDANFLKGLHILIDLQDNPRSKMLGRYYGKVTGRSVIKSKKFRWHRAFLVLKARWYGRSRKLSDLDLKPLEFQYRTVVQTICKALESAGLNLDSKAAVEALEKARPSLKTNAELLTQPLLEPGSWIALGPGASFATKKYPEQEFRDVLKMLADCLSTDLIPNLVFLGDMNDQKAAEEILSSLDWPQKTANLCGKTTLPETTQILKQVRLILCSDTSLAHIAEAVRTPAGVIFGPTTEAFGFMPFSHESRAFSSPLGCRPCSKHGRAACRYSDKACFTSIPKNLIVDWMSQLLKAPRNQDATQIREG
ncbi:MAG: glycosyltransferase family 9 protein [Pseudomonadota bacterium]